MASHQRTFKSKRNHTRHTYKFYKNRKNDPKWRADYLSVRRILFIENTITLIVIAVIIYFGYKYYLSISMT